MKISGFTLLRNGVEYDYPFRESILSLLPLVDELVINLDPGTDSTLEEIQKIARTPTGQKIRIIKSLWPLHDPVKRQGGQILSEQSNIALQECRHDWCVYLQADEVLHEKDHSHLLQLMQEHENHPEIQGILLNYHHFYGSYDVVQESRSAYRREVRIIKKSAGLKSVGDAQSFLIHGNTKAQVLLSKAAVYHYGWVRNPKAMKDKTFFMDQLYHGPASADQLASGTPHTGSNYRYKRFWGLKSFRGSHPAVMQERIRDKGWQWDLKASAFVWTIKDIKKVILDSVENLTGYRCFEYRPYQIITPAEKFPSYKSSP